LRDYDLWVPSNAVASEDDVRTRWGLEIMKSSTQARTGPTESLALEDWVGCVLHRMFR
jgi:hypothetical protein